MRLRLSLCLLSFPPFFFHPLKFTVPNEDGASVDDTVSVFLCAVVNGAAYESSSSV